MPYVLVSSNVAASSVELVPAMAQISKALSAALDKPEQKVMVQLNLDAPMLFQASDEPCAIIQLRSIGKIDPETNAKTAAALTAAVSKAIGVLEQRIFMNFDDIARTNWARSGELIPAPK